LFRERRFSSSKPTGWRYLFLVRTIDLLRAACAFDNMGIEAVEGRCRIVFASDAGGNLAVDHGRFWYRLSGGRSWSGPWTSPSKADGANGGGH